MSSDKRLGKILIELGMIDQEQLKEGLLKQRESGRPIGQELIELGHISSKQRAEAMAVHLGFDFTTIGIEDKISTQLLAMIDAETCRQRHVMPLDFDGSNLTLAMVDPTDYEFIDELSFTLRCQISPVVVEISDLQAAINHSYGLSEAAIDLELEDMDETLEQKEKVEEEEDDDAPVIRLVHSIVLTAYKSRCSDIHIEPMESRVRIRYRVDGSCVEVDKFKIPKRLQGAVLARVKIMAGMDISEKRKPQDGQINFPVSRKKVIDLRVSALPAVHGESVVLRILDKDNLKTSPEELGFSEENLGRFKISINKPSGIFLCTGPTGSGKTTTLYGALQHLNRPDVKIITAEDPVEYHISGINQCEAKHQISLDFARILRAMLRQAPNVILVGEIRDQETATIAIEAALTGHFVFSTLHTNDAPSSITRLIDMNVEPFLVASSVQSILAQRLVKRICEHCKEAYDPDDKEKRQADVNTEEWASTTWYRGAGCDQCGGTGFSGRFAIHELFMMNRELMDLTFANSSSTQLRKKALQSGMVSLRGDALQKAAQGLTTLSEVIKTTKSDREALEAIG